jgi:hypothetical protein
MKVIWCKVCVWWTPVTEYVVCGTLSQRRGWYMVSVPGPPSVCYEPLPWNRCDEQPSPPQATLSLSVLTAVVGVLRVCRSCILGGKLCLCATRVFWGGSCALSAPEWINPPAPGAAKPSVSAVPFVGPTGDGTWVRCIPPCQ